MKNNPSSTSPEAVYVDTIIVPAGSTLDLNNLHLYARTLKIAGTVINGTVQQVTGETAPTVTADPTSQTILAGGAAIFTAAASGNPAPTVQWEVNIGSGFLDLTDGAVYGGSSSDTLTITAATAAMNGYQYEAVFSNGVGTAATTTAARLTVDTAPIITKNLTNQTVNAGGTATFTAAASGNPTPSVQWHVSTDNGELESGLRGTNDQSTYRVAATAVMNGYQYEAVFSNGVAQRQPPRRPS